MIASETEFFINDRPKEKGLLGSFKSIFWNVECVLYKGYSKAISVETQGKKYNVSICAIFKNEAPYLKEWIEFNNIVGVDHFYMYNNNSEDDYEAVLKPYIKSGLVTLIDWPQNQKQMECYQTCIKDFSGETKWLGFIDIDEFIWIH